MRPLGHYRLASAAAGDDTTLARYVRDERGQHKARKHQPRMLGFASFITEGRTKFTKGVKRVDQMSHLLVSGHSNVKIGRDVRKGKFRGYWIYTLSLEERKTCPSSCQHWQNCYGNNMPFAKRIDHTDPAFLPALEREIDELCNKKLGVLIRLHALGDFYSPEYVGFWRKMLVRYSNLALFGYTARNNEDEIGPVIFQLRRDFGFRAMIRSSNGERHDMSTITVAEGSLVPENAFGCPEQTGKTKCCATCGACWSTTKNVAFMEH